MLATHPRAEMHLVCPSIAMPSQPVNAFFAPRSLAQVKQAVSRVCAMCAAERGCQMPAECAHPPPAVKCRPIEYQRWSAKVYQA
jgi:hypothetical protein